MRSSTDELVQPRVRSAPAPARVEGTKATWTTYRYRCAPSRRQAWVALWLWAALWALYEAWGGAYSWHYFAQGADLLTHPSAPGGGLHLYAVHPELQIGPLSLVVAAPLHLLSPAGGAVLAPALLTMLGLAILALLVRLRDRYVKRTSGVLLLTTGLLVLPVWTQVAVHFAHLDDALALLCGVVAVELVLARRPMLAGLLIAAAVDAKPWAAGFIVLVLALPRQDRLRATLVAAAGVAAAWLPFIIGDPRTLSITRFTIDNVSNSALQALGVHTASTPAWDRPAQLVLGVAVAAVCVRRGRWPAVLLAVITARLLLDPQTYPYYASGLLVAAAVVDLLRSQRRLPVWTACAAVWFAADQLGTLVLPPTWLGILRAGYCIAVLVALCLAPSTTALHAGARTPAPAPGESRLPDVLGRKMSVGRSRLTVP